MLNWRNVHDSLYRLSGITINGIDDLPAQDAVVLNVVVTISSIVILLLKLSLKVMGLTA